jgi:hypothetical protein
MKRNDTKQQFLNYFLSLDSMGPGFVLNIDGKETYRTLFGTFFTIIAVIISIFTVWGSLESVLYKTNPNIYSSSVYDDEPLSLNNTSLKFYITVLNFNMENFTYSVINKEEFKLNPVYFIMKANNSGAYFISNFTLLDDCGDSIFKDYNNGFVSEKEHLSQESVEGMRKNAYCLPDINYTIGSNLQEQIMFSVDFVYGIYKQAFEKYENIVIRFTYQTVMVNPDNFTNYYNYAWKDSYFLLKRNKMELYQFNIEKMRLSKDQTTFIFSDEIDKELINGINLVQSASLDKTATDKDSMFSISLFKNNLSTKTNIKYKSFNDVISDFGGSFGVLFPLLQVILQWVILKFYNIVILDDDLRVFKTSDENYGEYFKKYILELNNYETKKEGIKSPTMLNLHKENNSVPDQINQYVNSFDKQGEVFIYKQSETNESFIKKSINLIKSKRNIQINAVKSCFKNSRNDKRAEIMKNILGKYKKLLEETLNVKNIFSSRTMVDNMVKVLFSKEDIQILNGKSIELKHFMLNDKIEDSNDEYLVEYLMKLNYKEKQNRKLLKKYIINNF